MSVRSTMAAILLAACLPLAPSGVAAGDAAVRAWKGSITIPTYGWQEDVNPKFWAMEGAVKGSTTVQASIIYPYTMQDHLSRTREDRTYEALFLENEFLKVTCLPELGGRLHSVHDKTEGKETFHLNRVIKPGMIAMRGAFISGGVEWNAGPHVHTVTIVSPVTAFLGRGSDGSAWIEVSNLEQSLRTRWTVRVTLRPGRARLEEDIRLENPVDALSPYYFWNCTAFPNRPGTRFIYPMTLGTDHHGVRFFDWPVHEGRDLSWLKNHETWASVFAVNCAYDFFGAYDVDEDRGVVQVADHHVLPGKKAWTWGTWDYGLVSQENLTDEDGPYIEVQSGPLPTQSDYGMLAPGQSLSWREWWYPVHGLGEGFEYASEDLAVQRRETSEGLELRIIGTARFPGARIVLAQDGRRLLERRLDLTPEEPRSVALSPPPRGPVEVAVVDAAGVPLARFVTPLPIPEEPPPDPGLREPARGDEATAEDLFRWGQRFDRSTDRPRARATYERVLEKDPLHRGALRSLGVLDVEAGLYSRAIDRLEKALRRRPDDDGLAWYFLGVAHLRQGHLAPALRAAYRAARCLGTASLGQDLAGRAHLRGGEFEEACAAFARAVRADGTSRLARDHLALAEHVRASRSPERPGSGRGRVDPGSPSRPVPRALRALREAGGLEAFAREMRDGLGEIDFEMIEVALTFAEVGLAAEAASLLDAVCVQPVPPERRNPLTLYHLAHLEHLAGRETVARGRLAEARGIHRDLVFPSRPQTVDVLRWALEADGDDAHAHLHLGNLLANLGRLDEAVEHWREAVRRKPSLSVAWRNLGLWWWTKGDDLTEATASYRRAISARPSDQTLYRDLAEILIDAERRPEAIRVLETMPSDGMRRADVIVLLARAYDDSARWTDAIDLLASTPYFVNWEGSSVTRDLFCRAHLARGEERLEAGELEAALADFDAALTYPENLGVGRSNRPEDAAAHYWRGRALSALGRREEALAAWRAGAGGAEGSATQNRHRELCREALR